MDIHNFDFRAYLCIAYISSDSMVVCVVERPRSGKLLFSLIEKSRVQACV